MVLMTRSQSKNASTGMDRLVLRENVHIVEFCKILVIVEALGAVKSSQSSKRNPRRLSWG